MVQSRGDRGRNGVGCHRRGGVMVGLDSKLEQCNAAGVGAADTRKAKSEGGFCVHTYYLLFRRGCGVVLSCRELFKNKVR